SSNRIAFDDADDLINESEQTGVTLSGTVEAGATVDRVYITDSRGISYFVDANDISVDGDGNVTVTGQDVSSLADGALTVTMTVTDDAGNQGSVEGTATLDTVAPGEGGDSSNRIAFDDADDLINESEQAGVTFSGTVEDGATVDSIIITGSQGGSVTVDSSDISVDGDGNVTVVSQGLTGLADGELTVTMTVTDEAGNQGSVEGTATLDTVAPGEGGDSSNSIAFDETDGVISESEQTAVTFSGTVEDGATVDSIIITGSQGGSVTVDANDISVDGDGNVTVTDQDVSSLTDGTLTVTMTVTDDVGNQGSVEDIATLYTVAPGEGGEGSYSIAFDDADGLINESEQTAVTFSGTVEDGAAIDSIIITGSQGGSVTVDSGDISVDGDGNVTVTGQDVSSLADGALTVTMAVTNDVGNQGSVEDTATLDTAAPGKGGDSSYSIAFDDTDGMINDTEQTGVTFSGTVEAGATINLVSITDSRGTSHVVDANDISVDGDGNVTVTDQDVSSLTDGTLTVTMTVTDEAGNQGSVEDTATLDTAVLGEDSSYSIVFDETDGVINDTEQTDVTFSGTVEDGATVDSIIITGSQGGSVTVDANDISVDGDGNVTVTGQDVSSLADGELTATMMVTDEAGNQGSVEDFAALDADAMRTEEVSNPLTLTNHGSKSASYQNSFGYYVKGENGEPTVGKIVWANVYNSVGAQFEVDQYAKNEIGFFIIPDGLTQNSGLISDNLDIEFRQDNAGNWQAFGNDSYLTGKETNVLFDQSSLNADGQTYMKDDPDITGNLNFEDSLGGSYVDGGLFSGGTYEYDYNDVRVSAEWGREITTVTGNDGFDVLEASLGNEVLIGGASADMFEWSLENMPKSSNGDYSEADIVADFSNDGSSQDTLSFRDDLSQLINSGGSVVAFWETTNNEEQVGTLSFNIDTDKDNVVDQTIKVEGLHMTVNDAGQKEVEVNTLINGQKGHLKLTEGDNTADFSTDEGTILEINLGTSTDW
ncbi:hypothetical protein BZG06_15430, partial [Salinivibrio kushneri]